MSFQLSSPAGNINSLQNTGGQPTTVGVCGDYDLTFTIVAGSKELVSGVLNEATLEAL